jgi:hypothetical protein
MRPLTPHLPRARRSARTLAAAAFAAASLLGLGADGAGAQTAGNPTGASAVAATPPWIRARLDARLDARTRAAVERVVDSAYIAGIPAEPLVDKALEGASKRAPGDLIVRAVRTLAVALGTARQQLGANSLPSELTAGAAAVRAGVEADALRTLRQDRPGQPLTVSLGVLADLVASGIPADDATRTVLALTKAGLVDEQLVAFRRDVERDVGIGAPPGLALQRNAGGLRGDGPRASLGPGSGGPSGPASRPKTRP